MRQGPWTGWVLGLLCLGALTWGTSTSAQAAVGGSGNVTTTFTTSTTTNNTYTRVDLPTIQAYQTRIRGELYTSGARTDYDIVYDSTVNSAPSSAEVQAAFVAAHNAVHDGAYDPNISPGRVASLSIGEPNLTASSQSSNTAFLGNQFNHSEQTVTTTVAFGPDTVLIGDEQSQTFFVAAGTINYNTNTHTENFIDQLYQKTVTNHNTYMITGQKYVSPLVLNLDGSGQLQASGGKWLPHRETFNVTYRALFDFHGNGFPVAMEWVGPKDGLLCRPKADGTVDGTCLFGTANGYENGFEELASLDANMDMKVSGKELEGIMVWQDANSNAKLDAGELKSVQELGVTELSVKHDKFKASYKMNGKSYAMYDWWPTVYFLKKVNYKPAT